MATTTKTKRAQSGSKSKSKARTSKSSKPTKSAKTRAVKVSLESEHKARAAWQGSVSFGLIHFPVLLFGVSTNRRIAFHQLHAKDGARVKQKRFCSVEDVEIPYEEIVRGYELTPGKHVIVEPEELTDLSPKRSKAIELEKFIDAAEIDPLYYDASYFVVPAEGAGAPYALLREAMHREKRAAVARLVIHGKEHLVSLWPRDEMLIVSTLHFVDEISDPTKFDAGDKAPQKTRKAAELKAACQLVSALSSEFDIGDYRDEFRDQVIKLIEAKAAGKALAVEPDIADRKPAKDLMAALEESLASVDSPSRRKTSARKRGNGGSHKKPTKAHR